MARYLEGSESIWSTKIKAKKLYFYFCAITLSFSLSMSQNSIPTERLDVPSDIYPDLSNLSVEDLRSTYHSVLAHKSNKMVNTRRQAKVTKPKYNTSPLKTKSKKSKPIKHKPQNATSSPSCLVNPQESMDVEDEIMQIPGVDTQSHRSHETITLSSDELLRRLTAMEEYTRNLNNQLLLVQKSHHELATEIHSNFPKGNTHANCLIVCSRKWELLGKVGKFLQTYM